MPFSPITRLTCSGGGQGWRPTGRPRPPPGAARSPSMSKKTPPSMWPAASASRPRRVGSRYHRTAATRRSASPLWAASQSVETIGFRSLLRLLRHLRHRRLHLLVAGGELPGGGGDGALLDLRHLLRVDVRLPEDVRALRGGEG